MDTQGIRDAIDTQGIVGDVIVIQYSTNRRRQRHDQLLILNKSSETKTWSPTPLPEAKRMRSTFDIQQSYGTEALMGDAIDTQGIVRDAIDIRYSTDLDAMNF